MMSNKENKDVNTKLGPVNTFSIQSRDKDKNKDGGK